MDVLRTKEVQLPREVKSVLTSLVTLHTKVEDAATTDVQNTYERPRKRPKHTPSIHSAIEFTERLVRTRYHDIDQIQNADERILHQEERCRFGMDDALFREEEDIICLAFELSVRAIEIESIDVSRHPAGGSTHIDAALRIVDIVQKYDRNERRCRRQNCASGPSGLYKSKQRKYQSLLRPNDHGKSDEVDTPKSVIEERFADKWRWLQNFRSHYDAKAKSKNASNDASNQSSGEYNGGIEFHVHRPETVSLDDLSTSSSDEDDEKEEEEKVQSSSQQSRKTSEENCDRVAGSLHPQVLEATASCQVLDAQAFQLRINLLGMSPSERKSTQVIQHTAAEIGSLLIAYGDADGASGIARLGDILSGLSPPDGVVSVSTPSFPLEETVVALLVRDHLTDAMGALRARAFLRAFVLPLMIDINPAAKAVYYGCSSGGKEKGKPASRALTSLLTGLCRDRPNEFVLGVLAPSLAVDESTSSINNVALSSFEPSRFQCELVVRLLKGKDGLSLSATALLLNELLPSSEGTSGMKWTEASMPIVTVCVNRQPALTSVSLAKLLDRVIACLSPGSKSVKLSLLFNAIVTKYSSQVKESGRVDQLKSSASRLKTFNSKTLINALKKI